MLLSALPQDHAVAVATEVARTLPVAQLFATAGLAEPSFVDPSQGGVPEALDPRLTITAPPLRAVDDPAAGRRFLRTYARRYGSVQPSAIYGYAAMALLLDAVRRATADGAREATRSRVLHEILTTRNLPSVLGTYSIDGHGDTSLDRFGVYRAVDGRIVFTQSRQG